ncbi:CPBP family intramembrane metalloprotease [Nocardioidaceae bacterium]|nr:CPBP family intramembrane metalloprotease [Nocardioidaceae bacterium]
MFLRRRIVAAITLVIGSAVLAMSMATEPGDPRFIWLTVLLALVWTGGAFASGPLHAGYIMRNEKLERPVLQPFLLGLIAAAVFVAGALLVAQVPFLTDAVNSVLVHARNNPLWVIVFITLLNGLCEELFFRGALFAAIGVKHPVAISTVVYGLATVATLNVMLVFAALILGFVVGLQRRVTGGVQASMITHVTWSMTMLLVLPPLFDALAA